MNKSTTDTPRTDAKSVDHIGFYSCATVPASFARGIERELAVSLANQVKAEADVERLTDHLEIKNNKIKALELSLKTFSNWSVTIKQNLLCDPDFIRITKEVLNEDHENEEKLDILREKIK